MRLNKKQKLIRDVNNKMYMAEYMVFKGLCAYFKMTMEEIYFQVSLKGRVTNYYSTLASFTIACNQRPHSMMNHVAVRLAVLNMSASLKEDVFKTMNKPELYEEKRNRWAIN